MKYSVAEELVLALMRRAVERGMDLDLAARLAAEVCDRHAEGRSWDCDAYRALESAARPHALPVQEGGAS